MTPCYRFVIPHGYALEKFSNDVKVQLGLPICEQVVHYKVSHGSELFKLICAQLEVQEPEEDLEMCIRLPESFQMVQICGNVDRSLRKQA